MAGTTQTTTTGAVLPPTGAGAGQGNRGVPTNQASSLYTTPVTTKPSASRVTNSPSATTNTTAAPAPDPGTIKQMAPTVPIPNPMNQFASWTYATSLWWVNVDDFNTIAQTFDAGTGLSATLPNSYVIAEDSGAYSGTRDNGVPYRLPSQGGLNYNIEDIEFDTVIGPNTSSRHTNLISGTMTIVEPLGVTFLDTLVYAARTSSGRFLNYLSQPYMLQIDFVGYDDQGNQVPGNQTALYRKRLPIRFTGVNVSVTNKGAEYKIDFIPAGHQGLQNEHLKTPKNLTITGTTVQDVLTDFATKINNHWKAEAGHAKVLFADSVAFESDSKIWNSEVVYTSQMTLAQANPKGVTLDIKKSSFSVPAGTDIVEMINKVLVQSKFILGQISNLPPNQAATTNATAASNQTESLAKAFNMFRTTVQSVYKGVDSKGGGLTGFTSYDSIRNTWPQEFTFKIHQYPIVDAAHPALPSLYDSRNNVVKNYSYLYTGQNTDVLDFNLQFDTTWYTAVTAYGNDVASSMASPSTSADITSEGQTVVMLGPQWLIGSGAIPQLGKVPVLNPIRYRPIVVDQHVTQGMNIINDANKITAANAIKSIYSRPSGDMITLDLKIVGDPTLCKQDDWLYCPSPDVSKSPNHGAWDTVSQYDFCSQYGHIRMDAGALVVSVNVNSVVDYDTDYTNQGLAFPNTSKSLFSGLYKILSIKNSFSGGVFTQTLSMIRLMNSDWVTNSATANVATDASNRNTAASTTQNNLTNTTSTAGANWPSAGAGRGGQGGATAQQSLSLYPSTDARK